MAMTPARRWVPMRSLPAFFGGQGDYLAGYATDQDDVGDDPPTDPNGDFFFFYDRQVIPLHTQSTATSGLYGISFGDDHVDMNGIDGSGNALYQARFRKRVWGPRWVMDKLDLRDIPYADWDDADHPHIQGWYLLLQQRVDAGTTHQWYALGGPMFDSAVRGRRWSRLPTNWWKGNPTPDGSWEWDGRVISPLANETPELQAIWVRAQTITTPPGTAGPTLTEHGVVWENSTFRPSFVIAGEPTGTFTVELRLAVSVPGFLTANLTVQGSSNILQPVPTRVHYTGTPVNAVPATNTNNKWNGRRETGRTNRFAVIHTTEGGLAAQTGDRDRVVNYLRQVDGRYSGYHYIVDAGGYTRYLDPASYRAYHAYGGNAGVGIAVASDAAFLNQLTDAGRQAIVSNIQTILGLHSIPRTRIDVSTGTQVAATADTPAYILLPATTSGVTAHGDIQSDRTDPGPHFPWNDLLS